MGKLRNGGSSAKAQTHTHTHTEEKVPRHSMIAHLASLLRRSKIHLPESLGLDLAKESGKSERRQRHNR